MNDAFDAIYCELNWVRFIHLFKALVLKVGMDSIMASYFALFEVINHSFGEKYVFICTFLSVRALHEFQINKYRDVCSYKPQEQFLALQENNTTLILFPSSWFVCSEETRSK